MLLFSIEILRLRLQNKVFGIINQIERQIIMKHVKIISWISFLILIVAFTACNQSKSNKQIDYSLILGRWDLTVYDLKSIYPSWFEITEEDGTLSGRFQGQHSSCRPIRDIVFDGEQLRIVLPAYKYEREDEGDLIFTGQIIDGAFEGMNDQGIRFKGIPAPKLEPVPDIKWGVSINLLEKEDLSQWMPRSLRGKNGWIVENGILSVTPPSIDLVTKAKFKDFKLHLEFKIPPESNSGVYLRGRYEIQINDDYGKEPDSHHCGGLYGFIAPTKMAVKPVGQWNTFDITLIGRWVTLIFNGEKVIDNTEIPGITGSAINSREDEPGPIMLQCHNDPIHFRNIIITPAVE